MKPAWTILTPLGPLEGPSSIAVALVRSLLLPDCVNPNSCPSGSDAVKLKNFSTCCSSLTLQSCFRSHSRKPLASSVINTTRSNRFLGGSPLNWRPPIGKNVSTGRDLQPSQISIL